MSSTRRNIGLDYWRSSGITRGTVDEKGSSARVTGAIHHVQEDYLWQERGRYARVRSSPRVYAHVDTHTHVHEIDTWVCTWCFESQLALNLNLGKILLHPHWCVLKPRCPFFADFL
jgi:hypothetical protein